MKDICPNCEKVTNLEFIQRQDTIVVRGESIEVEDQFLHCLECEQEFEDPKSTHDVLAIAYREYRHKHGMLQPEEIRTWRKKYNLTQKELSGLLSWGDATVSRYEQGALQDDAHEKMLRMVMEPHNLRNLIQDSEQMLSLVKRETLIKELTIELQQESSFNQILEEQLGNYTADKFSGNRKLDVDKLLACIRFFCHGAGQFITKINKLLFYADFKHFKENSLSITGSRYARITYGPVPENYPLYMAVLRKNKAISFEEVFFNENPVEKIISNEKPDLSIFSDSEIQVLLDVKKYFNDFSAKKITDFSHEEPGYVETKNSDIISYLYAEKLKI